MPYNYGLTNLTENQIKERSGFLAQLNVTEDEVRPAPASNRKGVTFYMTPKEVFAIDLAAKAAGWRGASGMVRAILFSYLKHDELPKLPGA